MLRSHNDQPEQKEDVNPSYPNDNYPNDRNYPSQQDKPAPKNTGDSSKTNSFGLSYEAAINYFALMAYINTVVVAEISEIEGNAQNSTTSSTSRSSLLSSLSSPLGLPFRNSRDLRLRSHTCNYDGYDTYDENGDCNNNSNDTSQSHYSVGNELMSTWSGLVFGFSWIFWIFRLFFGPKSWADRWMVQLIHVSQAGPVMVYPIVILLLLYEDFSPEYGFNSTMVEMTVAYIITCLVTTYAQVILNPIIFAGYDAQFEIAPEDPGQENEGNQINEKKRNRYEDESYEVNVEDYPDAPPQRSKDYNDSRDDNDSRDQNDSKDSKDYQDASTQDSNQQKDSHDGTDSNEDADSEEFTIEDDKNQVPHEEGNNFL